MNPKFIPGATFPDFELPDHTHTMRKISDIQNGFPLVVFISRGKHCPRESQHLTTIARDFAPWAGVAYTNLVTISHNTVHDVASHRIMVGATWPFLSDENSDVKNTLDIDEYTDSTHKPMVPHTIILAPERVIEKIYVGYWYWGRPSPMDLWQDLRGLSQRIYADYDPTVPAVREAWQSANS
ncbi:MAG: redoxin domain-containing protein [Chloroflexi bacterium]|nr:redoxin domain-containing protein [Chloroflexota bacterium]